MNETWNTYLPFPAQTDFAVTGKTTGVMRLLEIQGSTVKISAKLEKWSWGAAPIKAFDGEVEITILNEKKLKAKSFNRVSRKNFESDAIDAVFKSDRFQIGASEFKASGEIVLASPNMLTIELKVAGAFGLLLRGPAQFQLTKKA